MYFPKMCAFEKRIVIFQLAVYIQLSTVSLTQWDQILDAHNIANDRRESLYYISLYFGMMPLCTSWFNSCTIFIYSNPLKMCVDNWCMCKRQTIPFSIVQVFRFTFQFRFLHVTDKNRFSCACAWIHTFVRMWKNNDHFSV